MQSKQKAVIRETSVTAISKGIINYIGQVAMTSGKNICLMGNLISIIFICTQIKFTTLWAEVL